MRISRIFIDAALAPNQNIILPAAHSHYLQQVLRLRPSQKIILFNGDGYQYLGFIERCEKNKTFVLVQEKHLQLTQSPLKIHLGQCISRSKNMDFTLQKSVELGIHAITPIISQHCTAQLKSERTPQKQQHWQQIIIHACEQSGRTDIPVLHPPILLTEWLSQTQASQKIIFTPDASTTLNQLNATTDIAIIIGPEGGLADTEIELALKNNFIACRLGPRILRTETAGIAALCALQTLWGDLT